MNIKRRQHTRLKHIMLFIGIFITLALVLFWLLKPKPTLIDLQKEILTAETKEDTSRVLKKLDEYYLDMPIPESIRREVETRVDGLRYDPTEFTSEKLKSAPQDTNIYIIEFSIRDVVRIAMIARYREDIPTFQTVIDQAKSLANMVKAELGDDYWGRWLATAKDFSAAQAKDWLLADQAYLLCFEHYTGDFEKGEEFAAFGLQQLKRVRDERIRLDLAQGFLVILYQFRGWYDLAFPLAKKSIKKANELNYRKRAVGLNFNYAVASRQAGFNYQALKEYSITVKKGKIIKELPGMEYYEITSLLDIAMTHTFLGNYNKALSKCDSIEKLPLNNFYKHVLNNTRGITYINLGEYDNAKEAYQKALDYSIADGDTINQIVVLGNLGDFYLRFREYERAYAFYQKALSLLLEYYPNNFEERIRNLIRLARVEATRNGKEQFDNIIQKAKEYIELIENPNIKGEYVVSLGQLSIELNNFQQAYNYFLEALTIYEEAGMLRDALEVRTNLIHSLIGFSDFQEAKVQVDSLYIMANKLHDAPIQIEAIGLNSYITYRKNDVKQAVKKSNQLINKIEELSSHLNPDNLVRFRQNIYPYLKNTVIYELALGRNDSAFIKLDYLKARETKSKFQQKNNKTLNSMYINLDTLKAKLPKKQMLVHYLTTEDTLYMFVLHQNELHLFKQYAPIEYLRTLGNSYIDEIKNSVDYLDPFQKLSLIHI